MSYFFSLSEEKKAEVVKRFWSKVDKNGPNGCWVWTDKGDKKGYGRLTIMLGSGSKYTVVKAHRLSYMIAHKMNIPSHLSCCHTCDNPPCVNPDHMFIGNNKHNTQDAIRKDRWSLIKLPERLKMAQEAIAGLSHIALAKKYNIKHPGSVYFYIHHPSVEAIYGKIDLSHRVERLLKGRMAK